MTGPLRLIYPLDEADGVFALAEAARAPVHLTADGRWMVLIEAGPLADGIRAQFTGVPECVWTQPDVELIGEGTGA